MRAQVGKFTLSGNGLCWLNGQTAPRWSVGIDNCTTRLRKRWSPRVRKRGTEVAIKLGIAVEVL